MTPTEIRTEIFNLRNEIEEMELQVNKLNGDTLSDMHEISRLKLLIKWNKRLVRKSLQNLKKREELLA